MNKLRKKIQTLVRRKTGTLPPVFEKMPWKGATLLCFFDNRSVIDDDNLSYRMSLRPLCYAPVSDERSSHFLHKLLFSLGFAMPSLRLFTAVILLLGATLACAEAPTAAPPMLVTIQGTVSGPGGRPIAGARVAIRLPDFNEG